MASNPVNIGSLFKGRKIPLNNSSNMNQTFVGSNVRSSTRPRAPRVLPGVLSVSFGLTESTVSFAEDVYLKSPGRFEVKDFVYNVYLEVLARANIGLSTRELGECRKVYKQCLKDVALLSDTLQNLLNTPSGFVLRERVVDHLSEEQIITLDAAIASKNVTAVKKDITSTIEEQLRRAKYDVLEQKKILYFMLKEVLNEETISAINEMRKKFKAYIERKFVLLTLLHKLTYLLLEAFFVQQVCRRGIEIVTDEVVEDIMPFSKLDAFFTEFGATLLSIQNMRQKKGAKKPVKHDYTARVFLLEDKLNMEVNASLIAASNVDLVDDAILPDVDLSFASYEHYISEQSASSSSADEEKKKRSDSASKSKLKEGKTYAAAVSSSSSDEDEDKKAQKVSDVQTTQDKPVNNAAVPDVPLVKKRETPSVINSPVADLAAAEREEEKDFVVFSGRKSRKDKRQQRSNQVTQERSQKNGQQRPGYIPITQKRKAAKRYPKVQVTDAIAENIAATLCTPPKIDEQNVAAKVVEEAAIAAESESTVQNNSPVTDTIKPEVQSQSGTTFVPTVVEVNFDLGTVYKDGVLNVVEAAKVLKHTKRDVPAIFTEKFLEVEKKALYEFTYRKSVLTQLSSLTEEQQAELLYIDSYLQQYDDAANLPREVVYFHDLEFLKWIILSSDDLEYSVKCAKGELTLQDQTNFIRKSLKSKRVLFFELSNIDQLHSLYTTLKSDMKKQMAKRAAFVELQRRKAEAYAKQKAEEEAAQRKREEEAAQKKREEEAARKKREEEAELARQKAECLAMLEAQRKKEADKKALLEKQLAEVIERNRLEKLKQQEQLKEEMRILQEKLLLLEKDATAVTVEADVSNSGIDASSAIPLPQRKVKNRQRKERLTTETLKTYTKKQTCSPIGEDFILNQVETSPYLDDSAIVSVVTVEDLSSDSSVTSGSGILDRPIVSRQMSNEQVVTTESSTILNQLNQVVNQRSDEDMCSAFDTASQSATWSDQVTLDKLSALKDELSKDKRLFREKDLKGRVTEEHYYVPAYIPEEIEGKYFFRQHILKYSGDTVVGDQVTTRLIDISTNVFLIPSDILADIDPSRITSTVRDTKNLASCTAEVITVPYESYAFFDMNCSSSKLRAEKAHVFFEAFPERHVVHIDPPKVIYDTMLEEESSVSDRDSDIEEDTSSDLSSHRSSVSVLIEATGDICAEDLVNESDNVFVDAVDQPCEDIFLQDVDALTADLIDFDSDLSLPNVYPEPCVCADDVTRQACDVEDYYGDMPKPAEMSPPVIELILDSNTGAATLNFGCPDIGPIATMELEHNYASEEISENVLVSEVVNSISVTEQLQYCGDQLLDLISEYKYGRDTIKIQNICSWCENVIEYGDVCTVCHVKPEDIEKLCLGCSEYEGIYGGYCSDCYSAYIQDERDIRLEEQIEFDRNYEAKFHSPITTIVEESCEESSSPVDSFSEMEEEEEFQDAFEGIPELYMPTFSSLTASNIETYEEEDETLVQQLQRELQAVKAKQKCKNQEDHVEATGMNQYLKEYMERTGVKQDSCEGNISDPSVNDTDLNAAIENSLQDDIPVSHINEDLTIEAILELSKKEYEMQERLRKMTDVAKEEELMLEEAKKRSLEDVTSLTGFREQEDIISEDIAEDLVYQREVVEILKYNNVVILPHMSYNNGSYSVFEKYMTKTIRTFQDLQEVIHSCVKTYEHFEPTALVHLKEAIANLGERDMHLFFKETLHKMQAAALQAASLFSTPLDILDTEDTIVLSKEEIYSLMSLMFFCAIGKVRSSASCALSTANFYSLYTDRRRTKRRHNKVEKVLCYLQYFITGIDGVTKKKVYFSKLSGHTQDYMEEKPLSKVDILLEGSISDAYEAIHVDFANAVVGGGILNSGCVQEEIYFLENPELTVSRIFTTIMREDEAFAVHGHSRYNNLSGYGRSAVYQSTYTKPVESQTMLAVDALSYDSLREQFNRDCILRELNKLCVGFRLSQNNYPTKYATGHWGCGAFNGDKELKFLIQVLAASLCEVELMYFTFREKPFTDRAIYLYDAMQRTCFTTKALYKFLCRLNEADAGHCFDKLEAYLAKKKSRRVVSVDKTGKPEQYEEFDHTEETVLLRPVVNVNTTECDNIIPNEEDFPVLGETKTTNSGVFYNEPQRPPSLVEEVLECFEQLEPPMEEEWETEEEEVVSEQHSSEEVDSDEKNVLFYEEVAPVEKVVQTVPAARRSYANVVQSHKRNTNTMNATQTIKQLTNLVSRVSKVSRLGYDTVSSYARSGKTSLKRNVFVKVKKIKAEYKAWNGSTAVDENGEVYTHVACLADCTRTKFKKVKSENSLIVSRVPGVYTKLKRKSKILKPCKRLRVYNIDPDLIQRMISNSSVKKFYTKTQRCTIVQFKSGVRNFRHMAARNRRRKSEKIKQSKYEDPGVSECYTSSRFLTFMFLLYNAYSFGANSLYSSCSLSNGQKLLSFLIKSLFKLIRLFYSFILIILCILHFFLKKVYNVIRRMELSYKACLFMLIVLFTLFASGVRADEGYKVNNRASEPVYYIQTHPLDHCYSFNDVSTANSVFTLLLDSNMREFFTSYEGNAHMWKIVDYEGTKDPLLSSYLSKEFDTCDSGTRTCKKVRDEHKYTSDLHISEVCRAGLHFIVDTGKVLQNAAVQLDTLRAMPRITYVGSKQMDVSDMIVKKIDSTEYIIADVLEQEVTIFAKYTPSKSPRQCRFAKAKSALCNRCTTAHMTRGHIVDKQFGGSCDYVNCQCETRHVNNILRNNVTQYYNISDCQTVTVRSTDFRRTVCGEDVIYPNKIYIVCVTKYYYYETIFTQNTRPDEPLNCAYDTLQGTVNVQVISKEAGTAEKVKNSMKSFIMYGMSFIKDIREKLLNFFEKIPYVSDYTYSAARFVRYYTDIIYAFIKKHVVSLENHVYNFYNMIEQQLSANGVEMEHFNELRTESYGMIEYFLKPQRLDRAEFLFLVTVYDVEDEISTAVETYLAPSLTKVDSWRASVGSKHCYYHPGYVTMENLAMQVQKATEMKGKHIFVVGIQGEEKAFYEYALKFGANVLYFGPNFIIVEEVVGNKVTRSIIPDTYARILDKIWGLELCTLVKNTNSVIKKYQCKSGVQDRMFILPDDSEREDTTVARYFIRFSRELLHTLMRNMQVHFNLGIKHIMFDKINTDTKLHYLNNALDYMSRLKVNDLESNIYCSRDKYCPTTLKYRELDSIVTEIDLCCYVRTYQSKITNLARGLFMNYYEVDDYGNKRYVVAVRIANLVPFRESLEKDSEISFSSVADTHGDNFYKNWCILGECLAFNATNAFPKLEQNTCRIVLRQDNYVFWLCALVVFIFIISMRFRNLMTFMCLGACVISVHFSLKYLKANEYFHNSLGFILHSAIQFIYRGYIENLYTELPAQIVNKEQGVTLISVYMRHLIHHVSANWNYDGMCFFNIWYSYPLSRLVVNIFSVSINVYFVAIVLLYVLLKQGLKPDVLGAHNHISTIFLYIANIMFLRGPYMTVVYYLLSYFVEVNKDFKFSVLILYMCLIYVPIYTICHVCKNSKIYNSILLVTALCIVDRHFVLYYLAYQDMFMHCRFFFHFLGVIRAKLFYGAEVRPVSEQGMYIACASPYRILHTLEYELMGNNTILVTLEDGTQAVYTECCGAPTLVQVSNISYLMTQTEFLTYYKDNLGVIYMPDGTTLGIEYVTPHNSLFCVPYASGAMFLNEAKDKVESFLSVYMVPIYTVIMSLIVYDFVLYGYFSIGYKYAILLFFRNAREIHLFGKDLILSLNLNQNTVPLTLHNSRTINTPLFKSSILDTVEAIMLILMYFSQEHYAIVIPYGFLLGYRTALDIMVLEHARVTMQEASKFFFRRCSILFIFCNYFYIFNILYLYLAYVCYLYGCDGYFVYYSSTSRFIPSLRPYVVEKYTDKMYYYCISYSVFYVASILLPLIIPCETTILLLIFLMMILYKQSIAIPVTSTLSAYYRHVENTRLDVSAVLTMYRRYLKHDSNMTVVIDGYTEHRLSINRVLQYGVHVGMDCILATDYNVYHQIYHMGNGQWYINTLRGRTYTSSIMNDLVFRLDGYFVANDVIVRDDPNVGIIHNLDNRYRRVNQLLYHQYFDSNVEGAEESFNTIVRANINEREHISSSLGSIIPTVSGPTVWLTPLKIILLFLVFCSFFINTKADRFVEVSEEVTKDFDLHYILIFILLLSSVYFSRTCRLLYPLCIIVYFMNHLIRTVLPTYIFQAGFGEVLHHQFLSAKLGISVEAVQYFYYFFKVAISFLTFLKFSKYFSQMFVMCFCRDVQGYLRFDLIGYLMHIGFLNFLNQFFGCNFLQTKETLVQIYELNRYRYMYFYNQEMKTVDYCVLCDTFNHVCKPSIFGNCSNRHLVDVHDFKLKHSSRGFVINTLEELTFLDNINLNQEQKKLKRELSNLYKDTSNVTRYYDNRISTLLKGDELGVTYKHRGGPINQLGEKTRLDNVRTVNLTEFDADIFPAYMNEEGLEEPVKLVYTVGEFEYVFLRKLLQLLQLNTIGNSNSGIVVQIDHYYIELDNSSVLRPLLFDIRTCVNKPKNFETLLREVELLEEIMIYCRIPFGFIKGERFSPFMCAGYAVYVSEDEQVIYTVENRYNISVYMRMCLEDMHYFHEDFRDVDDTEEVEQQNVNNEESVQVSIKNFQPIQKVMDADVEDEDEEEEDTDEQASEVAAKLLATFRQNEQVKVLNNVNNDVSQEEDIEASSVDSVNENNLSEANSDAHSLKSTASSDVSSSLSTKSDNIDVSSLYKSRSFDRLSNSSRRYSVSDSPVNRALHPYDPCESKHISSKRSVIAEELCNLIRKGEFQLSSQQNQYLLKNYSDINSKVIEQTIANGTLLLTPLQRRIIYRSYCEKNTNWKQHESRHFYPRRSTLPRYLFMSILFFFLSFTVIQGKRTDYVNPTCVSSFTTNLPNSGERYIISYDKTSMYEAIDTYIDFVSNCTKKKDLDICTIFMEYNTIFKRSDWERFVFPVCTEYDFLIIDEIFTICSYEHLFTRSKSVNADSIVCFKRTDVVDKGKNTENVNDFNFFEQLKLVDATIPYSSSSEVDAYLDALDEDLDVEEKYKVCFVDLCIRGKEVKNSREYARSLYLRAFFNKLKIPNKLRYDNSCTFTVDDLYDYYLTVFGTDSMKVFGPNGFVQLSSVAAFHKCSIYDVLSLDVRLDILLNYEDYIASVTSRVYSNTTLCTDVCIKNCLFCVQDLHSVLIYVIDIVQDSDYWRTDVESKYLLFNCHKFIITEHYYVCDGSKIPRVANVYYILSKGVVIGKVLGTDTIYYDVNNSNEESSHTKTQTERDNDDDVTVEDEDDDEDLRDTATGRQHDDENVEEDDDEDEVHNDSSDEEESEEDDSEVEEKDVNDDTSSSSTFEDEREASPEQPEYVYTEETPPVKSRSRSRPKSEERAEEDIKTVKDLPIMDISDAYVKAYNKAARRKGDTTIYTKEYLQANFQYTEESQHSRTKRPKVSSNKSENSENSEDSTDDYHRAYRDYEEMLRKFNEKLKLRIEKMSKAERAYLEEKYPGMYDETPDISKFKNNKVNGEERDVPKQDKPHAKDPNRNSKGGERPKEPNRENKSGGKHDSSRGQHSRGSSFSGSASNNNNKNDRERAKKPNISINYYLRNFTCSKYDYVMSFLGNWLSYPTVEYCESRYDFTLRSYTLTDIVIYGVQSTDNSLDFMCCISSILTFYDMNTILSKHRQLPNEPFPRLPGGAYIYKVPSNVKSVNGNCSSVLIEDYSPLALMRSILSCNVIDLPIGVVDLRVAKTYYFKNEQHNDNFTEGEAPFAVCKFNDLCGRLSERMLFIYGFYCDYVSTGHLSIKIEVDKLTGLYTDNTAHFKTVATYNYKGFWIQDLEAQLQYIYDKLGYAFSIAITEECTGKTHVARYALPYDIKYYNTIIRGGIHIYPADKKYLVFQGVEPVELDCTFDAVLNFTSATVVAQGSDYVLNYYQNNKSHKALCRYSTWFNRIIHYFSTLPIMNLDEYKTRSTILIMISVEFVTLLFLLLRSKEELVVFRQFLGLVCLTIIGYGLILLGNSQEWWPKERTTGVLMIYDICLLFSWEYLVPMHSFIMNIGLIALSIHVLCTHRLHYIFNMLMGATVVLRAIMMCLFNISTFASYYGLYILWVNKLFNRRMPWQVSHLVDPFEARLFRDAANLARTAESLLYARICDNVLQTDVAAQYAYNVSFMNESMSTGSTKYVLPSVVFPGIKNFVRVSYGNVSLTGMIEKQNELCVLRHLFHPGTDFTESEYHVLMEQLINKPFVVKVEIELNNSRKYIDFMVHNIKAKNMCWILIGKEKSLPPKADFITYDFLDTKEEGFFVDRKEGTTMISPTCIFSDGVTCTATEFGHCGNPIYVCRDGKWGVIGIHNTGLTVRCFAYELSLNIISSITEYTTKYGNVDIGVINEVKLPVYLEHFSSMLEKLYPGILLPNTSDDTANFRLLRDYIDIPQNCQRVLHILEKHILTDKQFYHVYCAALNGKSENTVLFNEARYKFNESYTNRFFFQFLFLLFFFGVYIVYKVNHYILLCTFLLECVVLFKTNGASCKAQLHTHVNILFSIFTVDVVQLIPELSSINLIINQFYAYIRGKTVRSWTTLFILIIQVFVLIIRDERGYKLISILTLSTRFSEFISNFLVGLFYVFYKIDYIDSVLLSVCIIRLYNLFYVYYWFGLLKVSDCTFGFGDLAPRKSIFGVKLGGTNENTKIWELVKKERQVQNMMMYSSLLNALLFVGKMSKLLGDSMLSELENLSIKSDATEEELRVAIETALSHLDNKLKVPGQFANDEDFVEYLERVNEAEAATLQHFGILNAMHNLIESPKYSSMGKKYKWTKEMVDLANKLKNIYLSEMSYSLKKKVVDILKRRSDVLTSEQDKDILRKLLSECVNQMQREYAEYSNTKLPPDDLDVLKYYIERLTQWVRTGRNNESILGDLAKELDSPRSDQCSSYCRSTSLVGDTIYLLGAIVHFGCPQEDHNAKVDIANEVVATKRLELIAEVLNNETIDIEQLKTEVDRKNYLLKEAESLEKSKDTNIKVSQLMKELAEAKRMLNVALQDLKAEEAQKRKAEKLAINADKERLARIEKNAQVEEQLHRLGLIVSRLIKVRHILKGISVADVQHVLTAAGLAGITPDLFVDLFGPRKIGEHMVGNLSGYHYSDKPVSVFLTSKDLECVKVAPRYTDDGDIDGVIVVSSTISDVPIGSIIVYYVDEQNNMIGQPEVIINNIRNRKVGSYVIRSGTIHSLNESIVVLPCSLDFECNCGGFTHDVNHKRCYEYFRDYFVKHKDSCADCGKRYVEGLHFWCGSKGKKCLGTTLLGKAIHTHNFDCLFKNAMGCYDCMRIAIGNTNEAFTSSMNRVSKIVTHLEREGDVIYYSHGDIKKKAAFLSTSKPSDCVSEEFSNRYIAIPVEALNDLRIGKEILFSICRSMFKKESIVVTNEAKLKCQHSKTPKECPCGLYVDGAGVQYSLYQLLAENKVQPKDVVTSLRKLCFKPSFGSDSCICDFCIPDLGDIETKNRLDNLCHFLEKLKLRGKDILK